MTAADFDAMVRTALRPQIAAVADAFEWPADLIEAIVHVESSGDPTAYRYEPAFWDRYLKHSPTWSDKDPHRVSASYGLLQVMYPVAWELGLRRAPEVLFEPGIGLLYGVKKLTQLRTKTHGNLDAAICAYNGGLKGNAEYPYRNQAYLDKVRAAREAIGATRG